MNKETRGNMCKNKWISKSDLPTKQSGLGWSPKRLSSPLSRPRPETGGLYQEVPPRCQLSAPASPSHSELARAKAVVPRWRN